MYSRAIHCNEDLYNKRIFAGRELKGALQPFLIQRHNSRPLAFEEFQITNSTTDHDFPHKNMLVQRKRAQ